MWRADPRVFTLDLYSLSGARTMKVPIDKWLSRWGISAGTDTDKDPAQQLGTAENELRCVKAAYFLMNLSPDADLLSRMSAAAEVISEG